MTLTVQASYFLRQALVGSPLPIHCGLSGVGNDFATIGN